MVQAKCMPNNHVGEYSFPCSNEDCHYGLNGQRSDLCEICCHEDKSKRTLLHCDTCHIFHLSKRNIFKDYDREEKAKKKEDKKKDDSDNDSYDGYNDYQNDPWSIMIEPEYEDVRPPPALELLVTYFRSNPLHKELPRLFDTAYPLQEFQ